MFTRPKCFGKTLNMSLLELLYYIYTDYDTAETLEFKRAITPLGQKLRSLARTADQYMALFIPYTPLMKNRDMWKGLKPSPRLMMGLAEG